MFGAKYSRMQFWLISLAVIFIAGFVNVVPMVLEAEVATTIIAWVALIIYIHVLANRIRDFGSNPWLALLAIIPFVGLFQALYYGCIKSGKMPQEKA